MTAEFAIRLEDICGGPWHEQSRLARERVTRLSPTEASRYFRSHYGETIRDQNEIAFRESFDQALEELQLLELAVACGYLPLDVVRPAAEPDLRMLLGSSPAKAYLKTYDFVPVRFLAARLGVDLGLEPVTPPPIKPSGALRYATFLALHSDFTASPTIEQFTRLLDDYRFNGLINAGFLKDRLAGKPGAVMTASQQAAFERLCLGLVEFVQTLGDLFLQLEPGERPLFGCVYAYWLSHFFGVRRTANGYQVKGTSFEDVNLSTLPFPHDMERDMLRSEQARLRDRISLLRGVWDQTRGIIDSLDKG
jgi:hypothetical protein